MIRRRRFADVIARQLDLFATDRASLLEACREAERAYDRATRADAEERYGAYLDLVETAVEELVAMRDRFGGTLDGPPAAEYERAFDRAVRRRWPAFGIELEPD